MEFVIFNVNRHNPFKLIQEKLKIYFKIYINHLRHLRPFKETAINYN